MCSEDPKSSKVLLLDTDVLTPALREALLHFDGDVDMIMIGAGLHVPEIAEKLEINSPGSCTHIDVDGCTGLVVEDWEVAGVDLSVLELEKQVQEFAAEEVFMDRLDHEARLLDGLRCKFHEPDMHQALDHLSRMTSVPFHHQLNQRANKQGREGKKPKISRRSMHGKKK